MRYALALAIVGLLAMPGVASAQAIACKNPGKKVYNPSPAFFAADDTRTVGLVVGGPNGPMAVPDTRPQCLPIPVRYNNPGAIKTPKNGWPGQVGKDDKGHAIFKTVQDGTAAWVTWMKRRVARGTDTPFKIVSMYAPPTDCVGSLPKLPDGSCPIPYGFNPTDKYAEGVAKAVGIGINDRLPLTGGPDDKAVYRAIFRTMLMLEIGKAFCGTGCDVTDAVFDAAYAAAGA